MSRVKERLKQYKLDLEKQTQYKQGLPGSALDIVNTLLADLEEDEKKNGWIPANFLSEPIKIPDCILLLSGHLL